MKGNHTAFPAGDDETSGLSKRELFAAMAMQGLLAGESGDVMSSDHIAAEAVLCADALLIELLKSRS